MPRGALAAALLPSLAALLHCFARDALTALARHGGLCLLDLGRCRAFWWRFAELRLLPREPTRYTEACSYFSQLGFSEGAEMQDFLASIGVIGLAAEAMRSFEDSSWVQMACGNCLESIALFNRNQSLAVVDAGAIELVVAAMRRYPTERHVQFLTSSLSSFNDFAPENRPLVLKAGGVDLIFQAMHNFYWDSEVQFKAWCGFSATSCDPGVRRAIAHYNGTSYAGIDFALQTMRDHPKEYHRVRQEVMQALKHISLDYAEDPGDSFRSAMVRAGAIEQITLTMREEMDIRGTQAVGCECLTVLAWYSEEHRRAIAEAGAIEIALTALATYSTPDPTQYGGISEDAVWPVLERVPQLLIALAVNSTANQAAMVAAGAIAQIAAAMLSSPDFDGLQETGCTLLALLCEADAARRPLVAEAGVRRCARRTGPPTCGNLIGAYFCEPPIGTKAPKAFAHVDFGP